MRDSGERAREASTREPSRYAFALLAIVLLAFSLRVLGVEWGLPDQMRLGDPPIHPDEAAVYTRGATLYSKPDSVTFGWGGSLYFRVSFVAGLLTRAFGGELATSHFAATLMLLRLLNVLLGTATVAIVATVATRRIAPAVGLASGALLACFPNHVLSSHYARPDILLTFLCTASLACACSAGTSGGRRQLLLGSALGGLALATSSWGVVTFPPLAVAWLLRWRTHGPASVALLPLGVILGYVLGSLESFLFWEEFRDAFSRTTQMHDAGGFRFPTRLLTTVSFYAFGTVASLCAWAGLALMGLRRRPIDWIFAVYLVSGGLMLSRMGSEMIRYMLFLSPAIAVAAAAALVALARALPSRSLQATTREVVCVGSVVLFTLQLSAAYVLPMHFREDPRYQMGRWLAEHARQGSALGITQSFRGDKSYGPRLPPGHGLTVVPLMLRANTGALRYLQGPLEYVATSDFASDHALSGVARNFFRTLRESGHFEPRLEIRALEPPLRFAGWFGGTRPGDLMYVQSSLFVYQRRSR